MRNIKKILTFTSGGRRLVTTGAIRVDPRAIISVSTYPFDDPSIVIRAGTALIRAYDLIGNFQVSPDGLEISVIHMDDKLPYHLLSLYYRFFTYVIITPNKATIELVPKAPNVNFEGERGALYVGRMLCVEYNNPKSCTLTLSKEFERFAINVTDYKDMLTKGHPYPAAFNAALIMGTPYVFKLDFQDTEMRDLLHRLLNTLYSIEQEQITTDEVEASTKAANLLKGTYKTIIDKELSLLTNLYAVLSYEDYEEEEDEEDDE